MTVNGNGNSGGSLAVYNKFANPLEAITALGNDIARSGMFGCSTMEQGRVFALECFARGIPPLTLADRYHVIFGKLSLKADTALAEFNQRGGKHKVLSRTADKAEIELTLDGETQRFALSWEEAKREPFVYAGKEADVLKSLSAGTQPEIKAKYQTPRARMQMLWARVVSDGVRTMCPAVNSGQYTPEEIEDIREGEGRSQVVACEVTTAPATVEPKKADRSGLATTEQLQRIEYLFVTLLIPGEARSAALAKRNASTLAELSQEDADSLIASLEKIAAQRQAQQQPKPDSVVDKALSEKLDAPCGTERADAVKKLIIELEPTFPGTAAKIKAKLEAAGMKLADMRVIDCDYLVERLKAKQIDQFFERDLVKAGAVPN